MARQKQNRQNGVQFTRSSAEEIAEAVRLVRGGNRKQRGHRQGGNAQASSHYLSKTTATWAKGTKQTLTLYVGDGGSEAASSGDTVEAWNKFDDVASNEWVILARCNGTFYRVSGSAGGIKRGIFTAPWSKGTTKTVSDAISSGVTYSSVKNYFANVTGSGSKNCAIAYVGTEWILIAAEC